MWAASLEDRSAERRRPRSVRTTIAGDGAHGHPSRRLDRRDPPGRARGRRPARRGVRGAERPQPLRAVPHRRPAAPTHWVDDLVDVDHRDREALGALDPQTGRGRRRRALRAPGRGPARRRSSRSRSPTRGRAAGWDASCSASSSTRRARTGCGGSPATSWPRTTRMLGARAHRRPRRAGSGDVHDGIVRLSWSCERRRSGDAVRLRVRLTPRASREEVTLRPDGSLAVRVTAPPVDGRANTALERAVAGALRVAPVARRARPRRALAREDAARRRASTSRPCASGCQARLRPPRRAPLRRTPMSRSASSRVAGDRRARCARPARGTPRRTRARAR